MADESAADSFLNLLGQSDLVSDNQMLALMAEFRGQAKGSDGARKLADELIQREILTAWQAEMLLQRKHRGFRLGPYRILKPLGQGGMSKVFLAEHELMQRRCAIKVLPSKYQEDADLLSRFHLEARAIAALDHPNIVRAYDFNKDVRHGREIYYLVMEYVEGTDLRRMIDEHGPLDYRKAADFICQAADGLAHAHAAGFVHRDIKPANLLVDINGVLKVLDLGLATFAIEAEQTLNPNEGEQSAVGTADYVAPEQVIDSRNVDGRVDIYSLGHTFYFLLTGRRPFSKPTIMELLMAHRTEKPEPISKSRPDVPLDLEAFIDKMTAKSPHQRFQTAKEVAEELRTWLKESGSAREYSRISALMADAIRTKQPSDDRKSSEGSEVKETTELELAFLDDEATSSHNAGGGKTAEDAQVETGKLASADTQNESSRTPAKDAVAPKSEKPRTGPSQEKPSEDAPTSSTSVPPVKHDDVELALPKTPTDPLSELLDEDLIAASAEFGAELPADQGPLQYMSVPQSRRRSRGNKFLKPPWLWVGVAGLAFLFLLVLLVIVFSSSSTDQPGDRVPGEPVQQAPVEPTEPDADAAPEETPEVPDETETEPVEPVPPVHDTVAPEPEPAETPEPEAEPAPLPPGPVQPASELGPQPIPVPGPSEQPEPVEPDAVVPSESEEEQPAPVEETIDKDALLANMHSISIRFPSGDAGANDALRKTVEYRAGKAIEYLDNIKKIDIEDGSSYVMEIGWVKSTDEKSPGVVLSAELKHTETGGKTVTLWNNNRQISQAQAAISQSFGREVTNLFKDFQKTVRDAHRRV